MGHRLHTMARRFAHGIGSRVHRQELGEPYFRAIVDRSSELLLVADGDGRVRSANAAFERVLGSAPVSLVGTEMLQLFHPDDRAALGEMFGRRSAGSGVAETVDARIRAADGSWHVMETAGTNMFDDAAIGGFVVSMRDVTERRQLEVVVQENEARYGELFDGARDAIYIADLDGRFRLVNPAAELLTGYSRSELLAMHLMDLVAPDDAAQAADVLAQRIAGDSEEPFELRLITKDGTCVFAEVSGRVVAPEGGRSRLEGIVRDTTERHRLEDQLRYQSLHDELTGLANRSLLRDRLGHALARSARDNVRIAVLLLDLDTFKSINDSLGRVAGDGILVELAERLRLLLRAGETLARLDGDEFAVVAEGMRDRHDVVALAQRVQTAFSVPFAVGETTAKLAGSIGISMSGGAATPGDLLRDADIAMYRAKAHARGGFEFFDPALRVELLRNLELDKALEDALRDHDLEVRYQPIVSLSDGTILAVEALARWIHPTLGPVRPDEFIPVAEKSGLIVPLGRYVIAEAARQAAQWHRKQPGTLPLGVFVNVSARELADPGFVKFVSDTLNEHDLDAADIALELTERVFIDDRDDVVSQSLSDLTEGGTQMVLDDFGTGYSALASLQRFPLAAVKIDRYFMTAIQRPGDEAPIVRAVVGLCRTLGLRVVAEGVETDVQLEFLRRLGCDAAQGFLLGRPQSASDATLLVCPEPAALDRNAGRARSLSVRAP
jgi:diguanylate cyclase (GGDEF)-like protein/PAS domain S-box-containing protein